MTGDLVSIIMLSHNNGAYVEDTVRSVLAQTYQNWEIVFVDDSSEDDTIEQMMDYIHDRRIHVSRNVQTRGDGVSINSALRDAKGRWIAFLNVGDVWETNKLERQIAFMETNGYAFSYTKYGLMNEQSESRGVIIGGKAHISYQDMRKCCWPAYLTVMYDAWQVGKMQIRNSGKNNDYALWLNVSEKVDCYLLDENLATLRTKWNVFGKLFLTDKFKWRYDSFRVEEDLEPFTAILFTIRNSFYGLVKWFKYVKRE